MGAFAKLLAFKELLETEVEEQILEEEDKIMYPEEFERIEYDEGYEEWMDDYIVYPDDAQMKFNA